MRRLDKAIIAIMVILFGVAIAFLAGAFETSYSQSVSLTNHTDIRNSKIKSDVDVILKSKTFSAHSPITIDKATVTAHPNKYVNNTITQEQIPRQLKVFFPRSHLNPPLYSADRSIIGDGYIDVFRDSSGKKWVSRGTEEIQYEMQGCYLIGVTSDLTDFSLETPATEETPCTELNIAASDAITSLQTSRMTNVLGVIGIAISILAWRASLDKKVDNTKDSKRQGRNNP